MFSVHTHYLFDLMSKCLHSFKTFSILIGFELQQERGQYTAKFTKYDFIPKHPI